MRKEIIEALKAKFVGVSENILGRIADKMSKTITTAEQVKDAVEAYTLQQVIDGYADSRATEAAQTAVHNYEQKYGIREGQRLNTESTETSKTQNDGNAEVPEWAKAILDSNKQLTERLATLEGERITTSRKQQLSTILNKLPEPLRKGYERTSVDGMTDEQFDSLLGEISTEVDGIVQQTQQRGVVFGRPAANATTTKDGELSAEQRDAIAHRDGAKSGDGQPF